MAIRKTCPLMSTNMIKVANCQSAYNNNENGDAIITITHDHGIEW